MLAAALAAFLSLPAGLPPGLQIDGDLAEWSSRPPAIEKFQQVAGARRVSGDADFSARVWIAFTREGLALAGEVRDDHVLFPAGEKDRLTADHVELWLAFPEARITAPKVKDCAPPHWNDHLSQADCEAWRKDQASYLSFLRRLFVRQYSFSPLGVAEPSQGTIPKAFGLPFGPRPLPAEARTVFQETADGYTFEAFLPSAALPASAQMPLRSVSALVDFVDNDEGRAGQEAFLSSSPRRRFGDRSTFQTVRLTEPVLFDSRMPRAVRSLAGRTDRFFFPAAELHSVYAVVPPDGDGDWAWGEKHHQPVVAEMPLIGQTLASWNSVTLEVLTAKIIQIENEIVPSYTLVTSRHGAIAGTRALASNCGYPEPAGPILNAVTWERPPGLHVALFCMSPQGFASHGPCGSCEVTEAEVVSIDATGKIGRIFSGNWEAAGEPVAFLGADLAGTAFPANRDRLHDLGSKGQDKPAEWDEAPPVRLPFRKRFDFGFFYWDRFSRAWIADFITWSAAKRAYVTVHQQVPAAKP
jgi:hypothetical protein